MRVRGTAGALLVAALLACGQGGGEPSQAQRTRIVADVETTIDSLFAAMNDHDADRVLDHYMPSDELVSVSCTTIRTGYDSLERILRLWTGANPQTTFEHEVVRVQPVGANGAVVAAYGSSSEAGRLYWTYVLRRDADGQWRIVQEHESWAGCPPPSVHPSFTTPDSAASTDSAAAPDSAAGG